MTALRPFRSSIPVPPPGWSPSDEEAYLLASAPTTTSPDVEDPLPTADDWRRYFSARPVPPVADSSTYNALVRSVVDPLGLLVDPEDMRREAEAGIYRLNLKPPASKTGAITPTKHKALIDWLAVTLRGDDALEAAKRLFTGGREELGWQDSGHGGYRYSNCLTRSNVSIYHGAGEGAFNYGMVLVVVSGQGCRQLEHEGVVNGANIGGELAWLRFIELLVTNGATFPRVDFAIDDCSGGLDLHRIAESVRNGHLSTRFKGKTLPDGSSYGGFQEFKDYSTVNGGVSGHTLNFGSRNSNMFVRMYNKGLEQLSKGVEDDGTFGNWVRVEMELKKEGADLMIRRFIAEGFSCVSKVLYAYIDFKDENDNTEDKNHKYRRKTADWWSEFIETVEKLQLGYKPSIKTLDSMKKWFISQCGPTLHTLVNAPSVGWGFIYALAEEAGERLSLAHIAALVNDSLGGESNGCISFAGS